MKTDSFELIPFTLEDLELFHQINTHSFVRQYLWDDEIISRELAREILIQNEHHFNKDAYGLWKIVLKDKGRIAGYVGLWHFFEEQLPQLIYVIQEAYSRQGLATACSKKIIDYAFQNLNFPYLLAAMDEGHLASVKVAQRLGMTFLEKRLENNKATLFYRIAKEAWITK